MQHGKHQFVICFDLRKANKQLSIIGLLMTKICETFSSCLKQCKFCFALFTEESKQKSELKWPLMYEEQVSLGEAKLSGILVHNVIVLFYFIMTKGQPTTNQKKL